MTVGKFVTTFSGLLSIQNGDFLMVLAAQRLRDLLWKINDVVLMVCEFDTAGEETSPPGAKCI